MESNGMASVLLLVAGGLCLLSLAAMVIAVVLYLRQPKAAAPAPGPLPPPVPRAASPAPTAAPAAPNNLPGGEEQEVATVIVSAPQGLPGGPAGMPDAPPRSAGQTIIAFDDDDDEFE